MILSLKNISKNYSQGNKSIEVLKNLNLSVEKGKIVCILGQSGSGKSTLLSLICGLDRPDSGEVIFENKNLNEMNDNALTSFRGKNLGIVFQQFHLIPHLTALENVELPMEILGLPAVAAKAREALSLVGLADRLTHFPDQLSGGECQRVAIARAMVTEPKLILADEPSGNLDYKTSEQVMGVLFKIVRDLNLTMVLVTHNEELANRCDARYVLREGHLV